MYRCLIDVVFLFSLGSGAVAPGLFFSQAAFLLALTPGSSCEGGGESGVAEPELYECYCTQVVDKVRSLNLKCSKTMIQVLWFQLLHVFT